MANLENFMNSMKRQKDRTLKDELPRSIAAQYATRDEWKITPERIKRAKAKTPPSVDVTGDGSKVRCYIAQEPGMSGP